MKDENLISQGLKVYKEKKGGPEMRSALGLIKGVGYFRSDYHKKEVKKALDTISQLYKKNQALDLGPLIELAYQKLTGMESYEVGAFVLKQSVKRFGITIDTDKIKEFGHNSVVNSGDRLLMFYESEFGVKFNPEVISEQAYNRLPDTGFAGRALDALAYVVEKGASIDKSRLHPESLESLIAKEIMSGVRGVQSGIEDAIKHIKFLNSMGIELVPLEELKGI